MNKKAFKIFNQIIIFIVKTGMQKSFIIVSLILSFFMTEAQQTQKPELHGKKWMAITGKTLAATAGSMIFQKGSNAVDAACAMLAVHLMGCTELGRRDPGADL
jgi:hypothetical protein